MKKVTMILMHLFLFDGFCIRDYHSMGVATEAGAKAWQNPKERDNY
jgi:hypothetical protein